VKHFLTILLVLNGLLLPCGCLPALPFINAFNAIQLAFITDIHITNATPHSIKVTPIGTAGVLGDRWPLPVFKSAFPAFESKQVGDFHIPSGSTLEILYDWDDINFSEIVVKDHLGQLSQIVTDPTPTQSQYHPPQINTFTIDASSPLQPVPANVLAAYQQAQQPTPIWSRLWYFFIPWITFPLLLWFRLKKVETIESPTVE
jgi:hypothetical protein